MVEFHGGRLPNDPSKPRLRLSAALEPSALGPVKPAVDYVSLVPDWPMYLNDRIGDCTCAGVGHMVEVWTAYGLGTLDKITDQDVLTAYEAVSGYDPHTGANDNGAVMQDVLNYWRKTGIGGHKILAFAEVDIKNLDEAHRAVELFGNIYIGINFPASAMTQFNQGQPWDVSTTNSKIEGGHAINSAFYDANAGMWKVITWGRVQPMTQAFWDKYVEEAWVVITQDWLNAKGLSPEGFDAHALGDQFSQLTGEPNPFPDNPQPTPTPTPTPTPAPNVDDAFAEEAAAWLAGNHFFYQKFQDKMREWLASR